MAEHPASALQDLFDGFANSSAVVVFEDLMARIYDGSLPPGAAVSENEVARRAGVSRTPAREAIQRLRELGLVDTSAGRTSRVATVTEERLRHALVVWEALFCAVIDEVVDRLTDDDFDHMELAAATFAEEAAAARAAEAGQANLDLFATIVGRSENPVLVKTISANMYVVRLGGQSLPRWIDAGVLAQAQRALIDALRERDVAAAKHATRAAAGFRLAPETE